VLDVGQGLAVIGTGSSSWAYDTGARFRSGFSLGQAVVAPNLQALSSKKLDLLFISHSDNDHSGGELGLKRTVNVTKTYAGQIQAKQKESREQVNIASDHLNCHLLDTSWRSVESRGDLISKGSNKTDNWQWRVLNIAMNEQLSSDNDLSCVVQFKINGIRLLLPGDISKRVEGMLVASYGDELASDILVVPHHGSKTSSSRKFIKQVAPQIAVISSGFQNTYNHPHKSVVQRYQDLGVEVYNTSNSGAVEIGLNDNLSVIEWRKVKPPVWRQ
jgi:competence protein ComEC